MIAMGAPDTSRGWPLMCRLGLHQWRAARDQNEEPCFACHRCGATDAKSESDMRHARWFLWGGWQPPSRT